MCTLSVVPPTAARGLRLIINRDERRTRSSAWPPVVDRIDAVSVLAPTDADATGTWVAAASTGIIFALMNASLSGPLVPRASTISRGLVIRALAAAPDLASADARLHDLRLSQMAAFRLFAIDADRLVAWQWDGRRIASSAETLSGPCLFGSSSLGDDLVEGPRQYLFASLLQSDPDPWRAQDRLHLHAWPDRRHLSVNMSRPEACTVSRTTVVVSESRIEMAYAPFLDGWPGPVSSASLDGIRRPLASVA
jgi:hypothetical protein